jgi:hypothetical protein
MSTLASEANHGRRRKTPPLLQQAVHRSALLSQHKTRKHMDWAASGEGVVAANDFPREGTGRQSP